MPMNDFLCNNRMRPEEVLCSRRQFLARTGMGLGVLGLAGLLSKELLAETAGPAVGVNHTQFPARANETETYPAYFSLGQKVGRRRAARWIGAWRFFREIFKARATTLAAATAKG